MRENSAKKLARMTAMPQTCLCTVVMTVKMNMIHSYLNGKNFNTTYYNRL